jgi:uncharacterized protein DUF4326
VAQRVSSGGGSRAPVRVRVTGDLFHGQVPPGAVYVGRAAPGLRASPFANPYKAREHGSAQARQLYRAHLSSHPELVLRARRELAGRDLACWCTIGEPCHADVLLEVVNVV